MDFHFKSKMVVAALGLAAVVQGHTGIHPAAAQGTSHSNTGTVYVSRPSQFVAVALSVNVNVNGKTVGSIDNGQCMKVVLPVGRHTISGSNMWGNPFSGGAAPVRVEIRPGASTYVLITPTPEMGYNIIFRATVTAAGRRC